MTERIFLADSRAATAEARVLASGAGRIVLDRTIFYARSGGQPGDRGVLRWQGGETSITEAVKGEGDAILHLVAADTALPPPGTLVEAEIDWPRRHRLMRMHTTLHLLCSLLPGAGVTGGQLHEDRSRLDFDLRELPGRAFLEGGINALVEADHPVTSEWVEESVLDSSPELVRTLSVKPPRGHGMLRLVRIGAGEPPVDLQPCGGTHVASTAEIGRIVVNKIENKGRQNRRVVVALAA
ncbi:MAG: alanyl-tRNA editing protein [Acetobacteraceae bacterium]